MHINCKEYVCLVPDFNIPLRKVCFNLSLCTSLFCFPLNRLNYMVVAPEVDTSCIFLIHSSTVGKVSFHFFFPLLTKILSI